MDLVVVSGMSLYERFMSKVRVADGCWEWQASTKLTGYGQFWYRERMALSHRVSWELHNGPLGESDYVLHHCDNRLCVRPDHLFIGSLSDNVQDMLAKGRAFGQQKTHCPKGHAYTADNLLTRKSGKRDCKACNRERAHKYNARRAVRKQSNLA